MDTALSLTRGSPVGAWAILDNLRLEHGSYTCVLRQGNGHPPLIGQMHYTSGERAARLSFLLPDHALETPGLPALLEGLAWEAGSRGAFSLLAEVEEDSPAFEGLRRTGFSVYAWQRVWKLKFDHQPAASQPELWEPARDLDDIAIRGLYQSLVPPLVQSAEPLVNPGGQGFIHARQDDLLGYIAPTYGPQGIYLQPLIHPAVENSALLLRSLLAGMPFQLGRPIYIAVRSYQAWLENTLSQMEAEDGPRHALLVKHLASPLRMPAYAARNGVLEKHQPAMIGTPGGETPLPLVHHQLEPQRPPARLEEHPRNNETS